MSWSSEQYSKFEHERNRPVKDLLNRVPLQGIRKAVDIGCGPGNSTEILQAMFPGAEISGMDSSENMITAARKRLPDVRFEVADISGWEGSGPYDLILSNAALQWVPDHATLFPSLVRKLTNGGCLAVQMPDNLDEPVQRLMRETAANGPWAARLAGASSKRVARQSAEWYHQLLHGKVSHLDIWRTTYYHLLAGGASGIVEWFKGTGLRPFLAPLNEDERTAFLAQYELAVSNEYPPAKDGSVLLPFPRLFIVAVA